MDDSKREQQDAKRSDDEARRRFEKAVERMVKTRPKPHKPKRDEGNEKKR